jgi:hypothetical protein
MGTKNKKNRLKDTVQSSVTLLKQRQAVFGFVWGLGHFVDEFRQPIRPFEDPFIGLLHMLVFFFAVSLMLRPSSTKRLGFLAAANIVVAFTQMPQMPNHNMIYFMADIGILAMIAYADFSRRRALETWYEGVEPFLRFALLIVYGSATLAKFNSAWFDPAVSCATTMPAKEFSFLPFEVPWTSFWFMPFVVAGAEVIVALAPLIRKLRPWALPFAFVFHTTLSLTPVSQGLGFTVLLLSMLTLYLSDDAMKDIYNRGVKFQSAIKQNGTLPYFAYGYVIVAGSLAILSWFAVNQDVFAFVRYIPALILLILFGSALSYFSIRYYKSEQVKPAIGAKNWVQVLVLAIVALNSLAPYLGVKTNATMTMFSNLKIEGGTTNHLVLPRLPISTMADDLVKVYSTSNARVKTFNETGLLYTWHELQRLMSQTPTASISYERGGEIFTFEYAHQNPELVSTNLVLHKLLGFRNASTTDACLW